MEKDILTYSSPSQRYDDVISRFITVFAIGPTTIRQNYIKPMTMAVRGPTSMLISAPMGSMTLLLGYAVGLYGLPAEREAWFLHSRFPNQGWEMREIKIIKFNFYFSIQAYGLID